MQIAAPRTPGTLPDTVNDAGDGKPLIPPTLFQEMTGIAEGSRMCASDKTTGIDNLLKQFNTEAIFNMPGIDQPQEGSDDDAGKEEAVFRDGMKQGILPGRGSKIGEALWRLWNKALEDDIFNSKWCQASEGNRSVQQVSTRTLVSHLQICL